MNPFAKSIAAADVVNTSLFGIKPAAKVIPLPTVQPAAPVIAADKPAAAVLPAVKVVDLVRTTVAAPTVQATAPVIAADKPAPLIIEPIRENPTWAIQPPTKETILPANQNVFGRDVIIKEEGTLATIKKDVFGRPIETATAFDSPINFETDALAKKLADTYEFKPGSWQPNTDGQAGGSIGADGVFGSFDLGNGLALVPKQDQRYLLDADHPNQGGTVGFLQVSKDNQPAPLNADGSMNPAGWKVVSTESQAMGGIMGTLSVIGAAVGSALFGPASGLTTDVSGSLDGLMTGALQTVGDASSAGAFGIIKTVAGNAVSLSTSPGNGLASQLATATPAIAATAAGAGTDKTPTLAQLTAEPVATAATTGAAVNATPAAVAAVPDNSGLFMVLITGAALLFFGVMKHG